MRFVQYESSTGRIICEMVADAAPKCREGTAALEISPDLELDINLSAVRDGQLVRAYQTAEEIKELERLKQERRLKASARLKQVQGEFVIAMLEEDLSKQGELKAEYRRLKAML